MKTYEKPRLVALSISGNSPLCACAIDIVGDNMNPVFRETILDMFYPNGVDTSKLFLSEESCTNPINFEIEGYCKNLPVDSMVVFNS